MVIREAVVAADVAPKGEGKLPVLALRGSVVRCSSGGARSESTPTGSAAPAERIRSSRWRAAKRGLLISVRVIGGLTLGVVASSGVMFVVQLDEPHSANSPAASRASITTETVRGSVDSDIAKDASGAQSAIGSEATANPEPVEPATRLAGNSGDSSPPVQAPSAGSCVSLRGARSMLVAIEPSRRVISWPPPIGINKLRDFNPNHPAILYDLGYVLQNSDRYRWGDRFVSESFTIKS